MTGGRYSKKKKTLLYHVKWAFKIIEYMFGVKKVKSHCSHHFHIVTDLKNSSISNQNNF